MITLILYTWKLRITQLLSTGVKTVLILYPTFFFPRTSYPFKISLKKKWVEVFIFNEPKNPIDQNTLSSNKVLTKINTNKPKTSTYHLELICHKPEKESCQNWLRDKNCSLPNKLSGTVPFWVFCCMGTVNFRCV